MSSNTPFTYGSSVPHTLEHGTPVPFDTFFLQNVLDRVQDVCFVVSSGGEQFYFLNHAAFERLGYSREELYSLSVKAVVTSSSLFAICDALHKTAAMQHQTEFGCIDCAPLEVELIRKDRTILKGKVSCTLQMTAEHGIMAVGGVVSLSDPAAVVSESDSGYAEVPSGASDTDVSTKTDDRQRWEPEISLPGKILIMDDEEILIDIALQMGKRLGLIVETAENGEKAVKMYREAMLAGHPYDAVLLDMTISGGMGGIEASKELHTIDKNVVAIVMSGYSDHEVMAKPNDYGFSGVISKPFRLNEFSKVLHDQIPEEKFRNGDFVS